MFFKFWLQSEFSKIKAQGRVSFFRENMGYKNVNFIFMNNKAKEFGFQSFVLVITRQKDWKRPFNP